jgi:hypothetical protein
MPQTKKQKQEKALAKLVNRANYLEAAYQVWESAAFSSIFLASSFPCSQAESTPAHTRVTQTVGGLLRVRSFG